MDNTAAGAGAAEPHSAPLKVTVKKWHAFAAWTWNAGDDVCGICRMPFESAAPDTKYPGDDSPVVWGTCAHAFHLQCITKWLNSHNEQRCPICRRAWEFKNDPA
jgi:anaphase-promoting complex subunit 11